jgi:hypothetical protein
MLLRTALISAVLVISLPLPTPAHDIYSHLRAERCASCCDSSDCRPAPYQLRASGVEMFVDGRWIAVPSEKVQYHALPGDRGETGRGHWCGSAYEAIPSPIELLHTTNCAILPPQAASAELNELGVSER